MATTMDAYAPFDSGPGANVAEDGWRSMQRRIGNPGVIRDTLNGLGVYADSTGMQVKVKTGELWAEGHWGAITSEKTLPVTAAHATLARKDLVVWRIDATNNRIELDVIAGTAASSPTEPAITRNSTIYEGPLAVVDVPAADTSIASDQVLDVRWYGGPTVPTVADDFGLFGDKISTASRFAVATAEGMVSAAGSGNCYLTLTQCQRDATVTMIRYYLQTARVGGFRDMRVYTGYSRHRLTDATGNILPSDTTNADRVHSDALPSTLTIRAGQFVCFAYLCTDVTTQPTFGRTANTVSAEVLNPSTATLDPLGRWSNVFKTGQTTVPSVVTVHVDGTWTKRTPAWWFALA